METHAHVFILACQAPGGIHGTAHSFQFEVREIGSLGRKQKHFSTSSYVCCLLILCTLLECCCSLDGVYSEVLCVLSSLSDGPRGLEEGGSPDSQTKFFSLSCKTPITSAVPSLHHASIPPALPSTSLQRSPPPPPLPLPPYSPHIAFLFWD